MKGKIVGQVSESEKNEAILLTERLSALQELKLCNDNLNITEPERSNLFKKIEKKESETKELLQQWWSHKYNKYKWEQNDNAVWELDYENCKIILKSPYNC